MKTVSVPFHSKAGSTKQRQPLKPSPIRVARKLAVAFQLREYLIAGAFEDQASLAAAFGLTRARMTQLFDMLLLAPDIQEEILFWESLPHRQPISERILRTIIAERTWERQRALWSQIRAQRV